MNAIQYDLMTALPEILVLCMAMFILLLDLFLKPSNRFLIYVFAQLTLLGAAVLTLATHVPAVGYAFNGLFVDDPLADVLKLGVYLSTSITLIYTRQYVALRGMFRGEFYALILFSTLGMMIMVSGQHFLTLYMGLELLSLCLYALVALDRDNPNSTEAAMKYFVLGALASGMLLYGMSMLYGVTGSLNISGVADALLSGAPDHGVLVLGLVFIVAGLAFKLGAAPFQMWVPDVYHGAPTAITLFIGSATKIAAFAMVIRLLVQALFVLAVDWQGMLVIMAVMSMIIGNIAAIAQTNIKRMLAYSTISHVGFLLLGFLSASLNGYASATFYILSYVLMTLAGFGMILLLSRKGFEADRLEDLKGLNQRSPWYAFLMLIIMFSMAGIPPTLGFYAKFTVLQSALQAGFVTLVIFAVLMALIGAFYYLRVVKYMYFDEPEDHSPIVAPVDMKLVLSINAIGLLILGMLPQRLMDVCAYAIIHSIQ
ncbi:NADH-quinone oxidoreductase subunit NuoN [Methylobacillus gramineus]|uniref:NADH-quinone oxidoreductase subunit NuoN n=1 Tax=Methylobacillus gramineus TaxID=755169 RepID=UPI001CFFC602|nr:NADH-quinone oxidoreductase subunit NuoN [Methylobacillus gramineus]MCB5183660.1 NADH-quinone oxidoreductase subunit NuoN [Methylobacillus gramineus]